MLIGIGLVSLVVATILLTKHGYIDEWLKSAAKWWKEL